MAWKQKLFSNMFFRNMWADFMSRSFSSSTGNITPYFQYKIGPYQPDYYLYFPKEPFAARYKNEIFNKLQEYSGYDLIEYLEFHYIPYSDKTDFLRFLQYELSERLARSSRKSLQQKLQQVLEWVKEKQQELRLQRESELKGKVDHEVTEVFSKGNIDASQKEVEQAAQALSQKLAGYMEQLLASTEERIESLTSSYVTGHIELNNHNHLEKVIQLFILLQTVQAPLKIARGEQLFRKFSATDMAAILHLHFEAFKDKRINTLQVKIREAGDRLNQDNPKVQKLSAALQDFFY